MANASDIIDVTPEAPELHVWDRRLDLNESLAAYHAFVHFRELPSLTRGVNAAFTEHHVVCIERGPKPDLNGPLRIAHGFWKEWRRKFQWDARVAAFDSYRERAEREANIAAVKAMNKRHANIAVAFQNKVVERLATLNIANLDAKTLMFLLDKAAAIERRARGEATEIVQQDGVIDVQHQVKLPSAAAIRARLRELGVLHDVTSRALPESTNPLP